MSYYPPAIDFSPMTAEEQKLSMESIKILHSVVNRYIQPSDREDAEQYLFPYLVHGIRKHKKKEGKVSLFTCVYGEVCRGVTYFKRKVQSVVSRQLRSPHTAFVPLNIGDRDIDCHEATFSNTDEPELVELPENIPQSLWMRYAEGRTHTEIGKVLGLSRSGAQVRLANDMQKIRNWMGIKKLDLPAVS